MNYVLRYRKQVIISNLKASFPEKTSQEIKKLAKRYYHHLCDITLESLKGFSMTPEEVKARHKVVNPELATKFLTQGKSVIGVPAHFNNWEWGSLSPGMQIQFPVVAIYKPLSNKKTDTFVKNHRAKFQTRLASIRDTALIFKQLAAEPHVFILAADQSPSNLKACYWVKFLHQDTAWLHGPEKYARKYDYPVLYVDIQKVKRGFYELTLIPITIAPTETADGEITTKYAQLLEKSILQSPASWLWSHKRWKHKRSEENNQ
jgi:KDO2-lipid IV(A) lauroyltransferase